MLHLSTSYNGTRLSRALKSLALLSASFFIAACSSSRADIEQAQYRTLQSDGSIDIRHYKDVVLVSTKMRDGGAFMKLFRYISGGNEGEKKIPMTAPVFMDTKREDTMSFVLPREYTLSSAPKPTDSKVALHRWRELTVAAIRFSGRLSQSNIARQQQQLEQWLGQNNIEINGVAMMAGYDHPMTLPAWRRNEILIPVKYSLGQAASR